MARPHCTIFLSGYCPNLNKCSLSHEKEDAPLCSAWRNGFCIGSRGNNCKYRHYYNENDGVQLQAQKRLAELAARTGTGGVGEAVEFSSPLRVRVLKEVERVRREEVDLDTGRRRSWLETNEYEVLDLCGDTPPPPNQSRKSKEKSAFMNRSLESFCSAPATPPLAEISPNTVPGAGQVWSTPPAGPGSPVHHSTIVPVITGSSGNTHPLALLSRLQQDSLPFDENDVVILDDSNSDAEEDDLEEEPEEAAEEAPELTACRLCSALMEERDMAGHLELSHPIPPSTTIKQFQGGFFMIAGN